MSTSAGTPKGEAALERPHRRQNLLTGEWVLVSPQRMGRPWQGQKEAGPAPDRPAHDPACYLCPGNRRAEGAVNPAYASTFVFDNDFPALLPQAGEPAPPGELFRAVPVAGTCRVICFSPRHDLTLADLSSRELRRVVDVWSGQVEELSRRFAWVQVFENKGAVMGCSNPHPHGQVWALDALPNEAAKERAAQRDWLRTRGSVLLLEVARAERADGRRLVAHNDEWVAFVPFWALWPFETLLVPLRPAPHLDALDGSQRDGLADLLGRLTRRYDRLFEVSFPYSMGWHGRPSGARDEGGWQVHAHFYPPLLRSAAVKKFMVGYELLGEGQRDLTPERAAEALRAVPETPLSARPGP